MSTKGPFLMVQGGHAEAAMKLYVSLFDDGEALDVALWRKGEQGARRRIALARAGAVGQRVPASDGPARHAFDFTPSWSFFLDVEDRETFDRLFAALSAEGGVLMPPDDYGWSSRFGWANDRFGISWQVNLA